jgi:RNA polymerase sigma factor (TIGR02999 family)
MTGGPPNEITKLLKAWRGGDQAALNQLISLLYPELHQIASFHLRGEAGNATLQSTALVHEAYMRLVGRSEHDWKSRSHFIGVASQIMRTMLVDRARARSAQKRGGGALTLSLDESIDAPVTPNMDLLSVDHALTELARLDPQQGRIVELRFFGGLTNDEAAEVLGVSTSTVKRDWNMAKAWMFRELSTGSAPGAD